VGPKGLWCLETFCSSAHQIPLFTGRVGRGNQLHMADKRALQPWRRLIFLVLACTRIELSVLWHGILDLVWYLLFGTAPADRSLYREG
jgi:hypothetical protein